MYCFSLYRWSSVHMSACLDFINRRRLQSIILVLFFERFLHNLFRLQGCFFFLAFLVLLCSFCVSTCDFCNKSVSSIFLKHVFVFLWLVGNPRASDHASGGGTICRGPYLHWGLLADLQNLSFKPYGGWKETSRVVTEGQSSGHSKSICLFSTTRQKKCNLSTFRNFLRV